MSFNPFSVAALAVGTVLWVITLVGVIRGGGMTRVQRVATVVVLLAAVAGVLLLLR